MGDEKGQTVVEYVLVLVMVVLMLIFAFKSANIGDAVTQQAGEVQNHLVDTE